MRLMTIAIEDGFVLSALFLGRIYCTFYLTLIGDYLRYYKDMELFMVESDEG